VVGDDELTDDERAVEAELADVGCSFGENLRVP
jgi:hypothetical protein